ncbi:hypothetical protein D3C86_1766780 [compost metagenome]
MISTAGRFSTVSTPGTAPGAAVSATGSRIPNPATSDWKYPDHPTDTADVASPYSSSRSQPIIHATISPSVA